MQQIICLAALILLVQSQIAGVLSPIRSVQPLSVTRPKPTVARAPALMAPRVHQRPLRIPTQVESTITAPVPIRYSIYGAPMRGRTLKTSAILGKPGQSIKKIKQAIQSFRPSELKNKIIKGIGFIFKVWTQPTARGPTIHVKR